MDPWEGWPFARIYMLLVAGAFGLIGAQVFLFHWRAAFRRWTMYGPVAAAPLLILAGVVGSIARDGWIGWLALAVFGLGIVDGLIGIVEHFRGIAHRIGGFSARNLVAGPPPLLPAMFMALALSGGLAMVWGAV